MARTSYLFRMRILYLPVALILYLFRVLILYLKWERASVGQR